MAPYFCNICNLFATENIEKTYHCDKCGSCRVKPSVDSKLIHCSRCKNCVIEDHTCIDDNFASDCPICLEYLFTSRNPCTMMKCGHAIHIACLEELIRHNNYNCPLCMRTLINND
jgi:RING finger/CHY zinc finger protein 1